MVYSSNFSTCMLQESSGNWELGRGGMKAASGGPAGPQRCWHLQQGGGWEGHFTVGSGYSGDRGGAERLLQGPGEGDVQCDAKTVFQGCLLPELCPHHV